MEASVAPSTTQYRDVAELEHCFDSVSASLRRLATIVEEHALPVWSLSHGVTDASWLRTALLDFWYEDGQDGRSTKTYVGMVAANQAVLDQLRVANDAKADFARVLSEMRKVSSTGMADIKAGLAARDPSLLALLGRTGLARLNLKQTWRQIPVAELPLERIHLSWYSNGKSIRRISAAEAEERLTKLDVDAPHVQVQLRKLAGIPSGEVLAQVQTQAPVMRGNLFYREPLADGRMRRAMNIAMPLFVPCPEGVLPDHNEPPVAPPLERTRKVRSDQRLEEEPFLPSLRAYRYR